MGYENKAVLLSLFGFRCYAPAWRWKWKKVLPAWQLAVGSWLAMVADRVDRVFNQNHCMSIKKMHGYLGDDQNMHLK